MKDYDFSVSHSKSSLHEYISQPTQLVSVEREIKFMETNKLQLLLQDRTLFSAYERDYCQNKPTPLQSLAGLWCSKIAFTRLTTKNLNFFNFSFLDLEVRHHYSGRPTLLLHGKLANCYEKQNLALELAITHQNTIAAAIVMCFVRGRKL